jgi:hypothetical protein
MIGTLQGCYAALILSSYDTSGQPVSPETLVTNYHSTLRNIPEEQKSHKNIHLLPEFKSLTTTSYYEGTQCS